MPVEIIRASQISIDEAHYVRKTFSGLWDELTMLLLGALVVCLLGAPAVVWGYRGAYLPAAVAGVLLLAPIWSAYCYLNGRAAIGEKPVVMDLYLAGRKFYMRSLISALPAAVLVPVVFYFAQGLSLRLPLAVVIGIVLQVLVLLILFVLMIFVFPLLSLFNLSLLEAWVNSLYLVLRWVWVGPGLLGMGILLFIVARWVGIGFWPVVPLLLCAFNVNAVLMLTRKVVGVGR